MPNTRIDVEKVNTFLEIRGRDFVVQMLQIYFTQAFTSIERMKEALASKDFFSLSREASQLEGAASFIGITQVSELSRQIHACAILNPTFLDEGWLDYLIQALESENRFAMEWFEYHLPHPDED